MKGKIQVFFELKNIQKSYDIVETILNKMFYNSLDIKMKEV